MIRFHWELDVYKLSVEAAMQIFELTKAFLREEMYSLTDQVRRSARSVSGQVAEGWRRRKYEAVFVNKMSEAEGEAAETQAWLEYCVRCGYITASKGRELHRIYDRVIGKLVIMGNKPETFLMAKTSGSSRTSPPLPASSPSRTLQ